MIPSKEDYIRIMCGCSIEDAKSDPRIKPFVVAIINLIDRQYELELLLQYEKNKR